MRNPTSTPKRPLRQVSPAYKQISLKSDHPGNQRKIREKSSDFDLKNLRREVDYWRAENEQLKSKLDFLGEKGRFEMERRNFEIGNLLTVQQKYRVLTKKFEELETKLSCEEEEEDPILVIKTRLKEQEKLLNQKLNEKERLKQVLKGLHLKVKYILLENKKKSSAILEKKKSSKTDSEIQYSLQDLQMETEEDAKTEKIIYFEDKEVRKEYGFRFNLSLKESPKENGSEKHENSRYRDDLCEAEIDRKTDKLSSSDLKDHDDVVLFESHDEQDICPSLPPPSNSYEICVNYEKPFVFFLSNFKPDFAQKLALKYNFFHITNEQITDIFKQNGEESQEELIEQLVTTIRNAAFKYMRIILEGGGEEAKFYQKVGEGLKDWVSCVFFIVAGGGEELKKMENVMVVREESEEMEGMIEDVFEYNGFFSILNGH